MTEKKETKYLVSASNISLVVKVLRVKEMLQKRQAAEVDYFTQPEIILDADGMNLV